MMKTTTPERGNHFSLPLFLVNFCVSCHFPYFSDKAHEMKGSQIKVCRFSGSTQC